MTYGSLCALGGLTPYPVISALNHFPEDFVKPVRASSAAGLKAPEDRSMLSIVEHDLGTPRREQRASS